MDNYNARAIAFQGFYTSTKDVYVPSVAVTLTWYRFIDVEGGNCRNRAGILGKPRRCA